MTEHLPEFSIERFVRKFKFRLSHDKHKFAFFLGAGCSVSSGIPGSKELVSRWMKTLYEEETGNDVSSSEDNFKKWRIKKYPGYSEETASSFYGTVIKDLFPHKAERRAEFEKLIQNKDPAFGYGVLAQLVGNSEFGEYCNIILTTNFDDLVSDALYIYSHRKPLVVAHESLTGFIRLTSKTPIVIKLHGDVFLEIENTADELKEIPGALKYKLTDILKETGIVFIGYGGNDTGILNIFNGLSKDHLKNGIYWINDYLPENQEFREWLNERGAIWVKVESFDKLMLHLFKEFNLKNPDRNRFDDLLNRYFETLKRLESGLNTDKEKQIVKEVTKDTWWKYVIEASNFEKTDINKAEKIYKNGLKKLPNSGSLLSHYALFLTNIRKDFDGAEIFYKKALDLEPNNAINICNYAVFLSENRKDFENADLYYKRALDLDPLNAANCDSYAFFLRNIRKEYEKAEFYYKKGLDLDPTNAIINNNYAAFLMDVREDYDKAETYYKKALKLDPKAAIFYNNYAVLLRKVRNYKKAEIYYKKSLELDPKKGLTNSNYGRFLSDIRNDHDKAEIYLRKALEFDSRNAFVFSHYARFLNEIRKDPDKAEIYFKKSMELDPNNPNMNNKYAGFLLASGKVEEGKNVLDANLEIILKFGKNNSLLLECLFYRFAHFFDNIKQMEKDKQQIESLLSRGVRSNVWDFSQNIDRAKRDGHPNPELLTTLAKKISEKGK